MASFTFGSIAKASHGLYKLMWIPLLVIIRIKITANIKNFNFFNILSSFSFIFNFFFSLPFGILYIKSPNVPKAHIQPQKNLPNIIVRGMTSKSSIILGKRYDKLNVPLKKDKTKSFISLKVIEKIDGNKKKNNN